ncbi:MAG: 50S ribosomal protein L13 [Candidatus Moranbacteria bacterium]|jgi:large subunit ribosomal protein L13|nr:50S ribosomal protein L13 [Candidatus Moranbacteria bacterium]NCA93975.1 50S ribosomal protein L13 [Sphingobacteriia bacterium]NCU31577.1 50S ribosomal protein L13 [Candidatus Moranbacteria bacterium]NLC30967.1 50S ribosomal protein L13 [Candidatus Moranbacteria bacterium]
MERKYYQVDARGKVLGRLATEIVKFLSGKNKVNYTPNIDGGDFVVVTNSDKVVVTGNKTKDKIYYHFTGYPGGIKDISFEKQMEKDSRKVIETAVKGMLPKNKLSRQMMTRLLIYKNEEHNHKIDFKI